MKNVKGKKETYITKSDWMSARNLGISPVKLLSDKSLAKDNNKEQINYDSFQTVKRI